MNTFTPGKGRLAVDRYEFQEHIDGTKFRHRASSIDVIPAVNIDGLDYTTVSAALSALANSSGSPSGGGSGFVAVPDGYDTWHNANGSINFDNSIPSLDTFLNPIFNAIINNTALPSSFERIRNGGIIFIKAGTYIIKNTINVPPGIVIFGEGFGTKIVNGTSLNTSTVPPTPKVSPTPVPLFNILPDLTRNIHDAAIDPAKFMYLKETLLYNFVIADNFVENPTSGDLNYKLPQNYNGYYPLIKQIRGSSLTLEKIKLIGRVNFSSGQIVSLATHHAIGTDTTTATDGTILKINNCFIDGFSVPIYFDTASGVNDFLEVKNSKIRAHGYLSGDGVSADSNTFFQAGYCGINVQGNHFFGNSDNVDQVFFIVPSFGALPNLQARAKFIFSNNTITVNITSNTTNTVFQPINCNFSDAQFKQYYSGIISNNIFEDAFILNVNAPDNPSLVITDSSFALASLNINGYLYVKNTTVSSTPYTITNDLVLLINTTTAKTINLPAHSNGRVIKIKDISGLSETNNITLVRNGGTGSIEGVAASYTFSANYGNKTLMSDGSSWWFID